MVDGVASSVFQIYFLLWLLGIGVRELIVYPLCWSPLAHTIVRAVLLRRYQQPDTRNWTVSSKCWRGSWGGGGAHSQLALHVSSAVHKTDGVWEASVIDTVAFRHEYWMQLIFNNSGMETKCAVTMKRYEKRKQSCVQTAWNSPWMDFVCDSCERCRNSVTIATAEWLWNTQGMDEWVGMETFMLL